MNSRICLKRGLTNIRRIQEIKGYGRIDSGLETATTTIATCIAIAAVRHTGSLGLCKGKICGADRDSRYFDIFQRCLDNTGKSRLELHKFWGAPNKSIVRISEHQIESLAGIDRWPWALSWFGSDRCIHLFVCHCGCGRGRWIYLFVCHCGCS